MSGMKRSQGHGSITPVDNGARFLVRGPSQPDGTRTTLGYVATREQEEALLAHHAHAASLLRRSGCPTFATVAEALLDRRELSGIRGIAKERLRYRAHLAACRFSDTPIDRITATDVAAWLRGMSTKQADDRRAARPLSRATVQRVFSLVVAIFDEAGPQERGLIGANPCLGLRVKGAKAVKTEEPWTFLAQEEQRTILNSRCMFVHERLSILFAIGTGLRQGEQFNLELRDLHVDGEEPHVTVRFGSPGKAPKNGRIRRVPLFGVALDAAREWLQVLPSYCPRNPKRLVFPTPTGSRRGIGKPLGNGAFLPSPSGTHILVSGKARRVAKGSGTHAYVDRFDTVLAAAGITRNVRWHDLRHSCASSLVAGFWGAPWTLQEVKDMLGHSSVSVTERYAHLGETALKNAARKVARVGGGLVGEGLETVEESGSNYSESLREPRVGLEPTTCALRRRSTPEQLPTVNPENGSRLVRVTNPAANIVGLLKGLSGGEHDPLVTTLANALAELLRDRA